MRGQQVLHHVQTFSAVEVSRLAGEDFEFVRSNRLLEAFTTLARGRRPGNTLQLDHFRAFTRFLGDVITGDLTAEHVIRGDMAYHFTAAGDAVERDHRDFGLVSHLNGVTNRIGIGRVDQQQLGAANG